MIAPGLGAWLVMGHDHGYFAMYYVMVLAIISLEVFLGNGPRDALTVNRIVATLTGVLMAMVISVVPPNVYGGDPKHSIEYYDLVLKSWKTLLQALVGDEGKTLLTSEELISGLMADCVSQRLLAAMLIKDASTLHRLPFFRVPETLSPFVEDVAITEALEGHVLNIAKRIIDEGDALSEFAVTELRSLLASLDDDLEEAGATKLEPSMETPTEDEPEEPQQVVDTEAPAEGRPIVPFFLSLARATNARFKKHEAALGDIRGST
jgi:hypothetical protein